jgi:hypothetical protein
VSGSPAGPCCRGSARAQWSCRRSWVASSPLPPPERGLDVPLAPHRSAGGSRGGRPDKPAVGSNPTLSARKVQRWAGGAMCAGPRVGRRCLRRTSGRPSAIGSAVDDGLASLSGRFESNLLHQTFGTRRRPGRGAPGMRGVYRGVQGMQPDLSRSNSCTLQGSKHGTARPLFWKPAPSWSESAWLYGILAVHACPWHAELDVRTGP